MCSNESRPTKNVGGHVKEQEKEGRGDEDERCSASFFRGPLHKDYIQHKLVDGGDKDD